MKLTKSLQFLFFTYGIKRIIGELYESIIRNLDSPLGETLRYKYYQRRLEYLGKNVVIDTNVYIKGATHISIGDNTHIDKYAILVGCSSDLDLSHRILKEKKNKRVNVPKGSLQIGTNCHVSQYCMIYAYGGVKIGNNCTLSTGAKIYSLSSLYNNPFNKSEIISIQPYSGKSPTIMGPVELEDNVWAGINVLISPGVKLCKNSFIRSNSVVNQSFPENSYLAGDPAIRIKECFEQNLVEHKFQ